MIKFNRVKWKNFLSTGNSFTEIDLSKNKSTLVVGPNGCGKSTMLDAISFGLFGKPHRNISKNQLINSVNSKECVVQVNFTIGQSVYNVIRGIRPNTFEIWKDGDMMNQSSHSKEYQKILEQNILKLNHKSFHQVVVLGSSSFIPFMQLSSGHRRSVIEDLLDINIFSKMNVILREQTTRLKDEIKDLNYKIDVSTNKIETQKKYIKDIKTLTDENKKQYEEKIKSHNDEIAQHQKDNSDLSYGLDEEQKRIEDDLKRFHDLKNINMMANSEVKTQMKAIGKTAKFFETTDNCPTCKQNISQEIKDSALSEAKIEAKSLQSRLT